jgi:hypothetical protein
MKSTIRSVAAIALSAVCASGAFAASKAADRNLDLLDSWFAPTTTKAMPANAQAAEAMPQTTVVASTKKMERADTKPTRKEPDTGMN